MLELSIYKSKSKNSLTFETLILGSTIVILYLLFPAINRNLLFIPIMVFILYIALKNDKDESIGKIYLTNHQIKVKTESNDFQINLVGLDKFQLIYSGHRGQILRGDIIGPFNTFSGIDNYLAMGKDNSEFRCRFMVESSEKEGELLEQIRNWESFGYDIGNIRINK